jgi:hypothetical protein
VTSFHTHFVGSEVRLHLSLFTPVLTGVRQCFFLGSVSISWGLQFGRDVSISDAS